MIILASASSSRAKVLTAAGVPFTVEPAPDHIEEPLKARLMAEGTSPAELARELALAKARAVRERRGGIVIGADQTLEFEGALLHKAETLEIARERLAAFRGRSHTLHAAVAVVGDEAWSVVETATLTMRAFSDAFLDDYLARNAEAARFSLGCYYYEGEGAQLFERVEGDFFAVLGLPLLPLLQRLRELGELPA